jgi:putative transposase
MVRRTCQDSLSKSVACQHFVSKSARRRLTTTAPPDSALRLELRSGELVLWEGRVHRLQSLEGVRARIQETGAADLREVLVTELRGLPSLPIVQLDQRLEKLRVADTPDWTKAQEREAIIRDSLQGDGSTTMRVEAAAKILGLSARTVRRLIARYTASAQTTSLVAHLPGPKKSYRRLGPELERIIDTAIQTHYLVRPRKPMESVYSEVKRRCHAEKRVTPSRNSVLKRIRALDARLVARKRLGAKSAESIALSTPGMLEATEALDLIQIDHTLADVMIVDSVYRHSIGRPWLSLAIDVATRSVLGFHLGLEAPSALAVALCIEHAVLPKISSAAAPESDASWDMFGIPKTILVDNGSEFHGEALTRGCAEYGIALTYRPVARPRFGAHIERLIGTMMGKIHLLPGSTDSSPTARGSYQSESEAKLTLAELNEWLYLEIAGQYHHTIHRMIGTTPAAAWVKSLARGTVPVLPADPARFVIGFLPIVHRKLQRNGLFFERIRYWADVLPAIAQPSESLLTRYDPRDLSRLYVLTPNKSYQAVPYADVRRPPITLAELRFAHAELRREAKGSINEERLFAMHERQNTIITDATKATKAARRRKEPRQRQTAAVSTVSSIDYSKEPMPLESELWESKS